MSFVSDLTAEDLIIYKEGDKIYSGGFQVNSILLKHGKSPFSTFQKAGNGEHVTDTNNVSDLFKNFAVPSGLLYLPSKLNNNISFEEDVIIQKDSYLEEDLDDDYVTDDIYDRLIDLASANKSGKGGTRRKRRGKKLGTKKNMK
jgi:hypothetical protein